MGGPRPDGGALCRSGAGLVSGLQGGRGKDALDLFLRVLTPSLFPFMALSALCVRTGLCAKLGRRLERPTRLLFGLNGVFAPVLLLSLTGGYPVGARAIAQLYEAGQVRERGASARRCSASVRVPRL